MFSAKGFSPVQSGLLANQNNVLHFNKSKMMQFAAGNQFAAVNGLGISAVTLNKLVCHALKDKSGGVPEPDRQESRRQVALDRKKRLQRMRLALGLEEMHLQAAKEAVEATKRNVKAAEEDKEPDLPDNQHQVAQNRKDRLQAIRLELALVEKRLQGTKEAVERTKRNIKVVEDQELLKKKVDECDSNAKEAFMAAKGKENTAAEDKELLKKQVNECDRDTKEAFDAANVKENTAADNKERLMKKVDERDCDTKEAFEAAKGNENAAGDQELLEKKVGECENEVKA